MSNFPSQIDPLDPAATAAETVLELETQSQEAQRAHRVRRLKLSIFTSLLVRPLSVFIPIVTIPLFLRYLGTERYGLYETIGALAAWLGLTNLGLGMGLMNRLTECDVAQDRQTARLCTSTLTLATLFMAAFMLVIFTLVVPFVPWERLVRTDDALARAEAPWAVWFAGMLTLVGFISGLVPAIYAGFQETHRNNVWDGISKMAMLVASFALLLFPNGGTVAVLAASIAVPTGVRLINLLDLFFREKPFLRPSLKLFDWTALKGMASQGILLFVLQMAAVLLFQTDKLIIAAGTSLVDVTGYAILGRLFLIGYAVYMLVLWPLWPASGEAIRRGDVSWVVASIRRTSMLGCGLMLLMGMALLMAKGPMSGLLQRIGGSADMTLSGNLIVAMTATFVTRAWVDSRSTVLNGSSILLPQIPFYAGHAVLNAILAIALVKPFGVEGVAWATPITCLLTSAWGYPWMVRRYVVGATAGRGRT